ncbi:hypothetical protein XarbCFBP7629_20030 [Xanthomonas arboricola]|nr:hypothetical protein XarbCFBP7629_20030 [Xanthomonas arboricola]
MRSMVYPDGTTVDYVRNAQGQTTEVGVTAQGGSRQRLLSGAVETGSGLLLEIRAQGYLPRDASVRRHSHIHISALLFPAVDIPTNLRPGPTRRSSRRARSPLAAQRSTQIG